MNFLRLIAAFTLMTNMSLNALKQDQKSDPKKEHKEQKVSSLSQLLFSRTEQLHQAMRENDTQGIARLSKYANLKTKDGTTSKMVAEEIAIKRKKSKLNAAIPDELLIRIFAFLIIPDFADTPAIGNYLINCNNLRSVCKKFESLITMKTIKEELKEYSSKRADFSQPTYFPKSGQYPKDYILVTAIFTSNPHEKDSNNNLVPLHKTVQLADPEQNYYATKQLLELGANVNATDESGQTVLHHAVQGYTDHKSHNIKTISLLLRKGADQARLDNNRIPALNLFAEQFFARFIKEVNGVDMYHRGADENKKENKDLATFNILGKFKAFDYKQNNPVIFGVFKKHGGLEYMSEFIGDFGNMNIPREVYKMINTYMKCTIVDLWDCFTILPKMVLKLEYDDTKIAARKFSYIAIVALSLLCDFESLALMSAHRPGMLIPMAQATSVRHSFMRALFLPKYSWVANLFLALEHIDSFTTIDQKKPMTFFQRLSDFFT